MTDPRDGQKYKTIQIGKQIWMAENLNYKTEFSTCLGDKKSNCVKLGRLYTWSAAGNACPAGWRLPSIEEFQVLFMTVGGTHDEKVEWRWNGVHKRLKSTRGWEKYGRGDDTYSFSALPGGFDYGDHLYGYGGAFFWSSTPGGYSDAYAMVLSDDAELSKNPKNLGLSVRCLKGNVFVDTRDYQVYKTVKIGEQVWMAENLNYEMEESECQGCNYGRLYTWKEARKICPDGWHLPSYDEWNQLLNYSSKKGSNDEGWINLLSKEEVLVHYDIVPAGICNVDEFGSFDDIKKCFGVKGNKDLDRRICQSGDTYCSTYSQKRGRDLYGFNARIVRSIIAFGNDCDDGYDYMAFWTSPDKDHHFFVSNAADAILSDNDESEVKDSEKFYVRCLEGEPSHDENVLVDSRDGKMYKTVEIGEQVWMAENLNYEMPGGFCDDDESANCGKYGRFYTWEAAVKACPTGWHLPNVREYITLISNSGGPENAGKKLKSALNWRENGKGNGFNALLTSECPSFWSSTENDQSAYRLELCYGSDYARLEEGLKEDPFMPNGGLSVRCLKD